MTLNYPLISNSLKVYLLCFLVLHSLTNLHSQSIPYKHYSELDGLPSSETYCVIEDHDGYIWIGTDRGLTRFDGDEFKVFSKQEGLNENVIFDIFESPDQTLWVLGFHTVYYSKDHKTFYPYSFNSILKEIQEKHNAFFNVISVTGDSLFLQTHKGILLSISSEGKYDLKQFDTEVKPKKILNEQKDKSTQVPFLFHSFAGFYDYYSKQSEEYLLMDYGLMDSIKKIEKICSAYHVYITCDFFKERTKLDITFWLQKDT